MILSADWYKLSRGTTQQMRSTLPAAIRRAAAITGRSDLPPPGVTAARMSVMPLACPEAMALTRLARQRWCVRKEREWDIGTDGVCRTNQQPPSMRHPHPTVNSSSGGLSVARGMSGFGSTRSVRFVPEGSHAAGGQNGPDHRCDWVASSEEVELRGGGGAVGDERAALSPAARRL